MEDINKMRVNEIIHDGDYCGREIVVKQIGYDTSNDKKFDGIPTEWLTGYVELLPSDLKMLGDPKTDEDLDDTGVFDHFYGGVTFFDHLLDSNDNKFAGFDTMHPGMWNTTKQDCIRALEQTVDALNGLCVDAN